MGVVIEIPVLIGTDGATAVPQPVRTPAVFPRQRRQAIAAAASDASDTGTVPAPASSVAVADAAPDGDAHVFAQPLALEFGIPRAGRRRRRNILVAGVLAVPVTMLAVRFRGDMASRLAGVPAPRWHWLVACALASVLFYVCNGLSMRAASGLRVKLRTVTGVQIAAAAANRVVPAGLGAIAIHLRFMEKRGMARPAAVAAVASTKVAGALAHLSGIAIVAGTLSDSGIGAALISPVRGTFQEIGAGPFLVGCVAVCAMVSGTVTHPRVRCVLRPALRTFRAHLKILAHSPGRTVVLFVSQAGTRLFQILALAFAVWAFGGSMTVMSVAAVYLVGSMVAGAAPTAGGVGALEPALAIGLAAAGGTAAPMFAAVIIYRLISYWLPVLPGIVWLAALRRAGDL